MTNKESETNAKPKISTIRIPLTTSFISSQWGNFPSLSPNQLVNDAYYVHE